jgi:hypothetical protein
MRTSALTSLTWKGPRKKAKVSNWTWETRPSRIIGGLGKRSHGGTVNPSRNRKDGTGNPPPTAGAPELHPNRIYGLDIEALPTETGSNKLVLLC